MKEGSFLNLKISDVGFGSVPMAYPEEVMLSLYKPKNNWIKVRCPLDYSWVDSSVDIGSTYRRTEDGGYRRSPQIGSSIAKNERYEGRVHLDSYQPDKRVFNV